MAEPQFSGHTFSTKSGVPTGTLRYQGESSRDPQEAYYTNMYAISDRLKALDGKVDRLEGKLDKLDGIGGKVDALVGLLPKIEHVYGFYVHGERHLATKKDIEAVDHNITKSKNEIITQLIPKIDEKLKTSTFRWGIMLVVGLLAIPDVLPYLKSFYGRFFP